MHKRRSFWDAKHMSGITIIEVMIVIVIIGILATIAIPSYNDSIDKQRLKSAAEATLADIRWARSESIKRNVQVRVTFATGANWSFTVIPDTNEDGGFSESSIRTANNDDYPTISLSNAAFAGGVSYSTFDPVRGTSLNNGSLTLTSARGFTATITVSTLGRTRICGFGGYEAC